MTDETKSRALVDSLAGTVTTIVFGDSFEMDMERAEEMILAFAAEVRREALEEAINAARVPFGQPYHEGREYAAKSIRALSSQAWPDPTVALARFFAAWWGTGEGTMPSAGVVAAAAREIGLTCWTPNKASQLTDLGNAALKRAETS